MTKVGTDYSPIKWYEYVNPWRQNNIIS
jgi:hypothetical protein